MKLLTITETRAVDADAGLWERVKIALEPDAEPELRWAPVVRPGEQATRITMHPLDLQAAGITWADLEELEPTE
jgi:hypothetical protein